MLGIVGTGLVLSSGLYLSSSVSLRCDSPVRSRMAFDVLKMNVRGKRPPILGRTQVAPVEQQARNNTATATTMAINPNADLVGLPIG
jgi:hypothetical protein